MNPTPADMNQKDRLSDDGSGGKSPGRVHESEGNSAGEDTLRKKKTKQKTKHRPRFHVLDINSFHAYSKIGKFNFLDKFKTGKLVMRLNRIAFYKRRF